ncbi:hypothetical protein BH23CHL4_BH23CHL4_29710 [soil metagenome]
MRRLELALWREQQRAEIAEGRVDKLLATPPAEEYRAGITPAFWERRVLMGGPMPSASALAGTTATSTSSAEPVLASRNTSRRTRPALSR